MQEGAIIAVTVLSSTIFVFFAEITYVPSASNESVALPSVSVTKLLSSPLIVTIASSHGE